MQFIFTVYADEYRSVNRFTYIPNCLFSVTVNIKNEIGYSSLNRTSASYPTTLQGVIIQSFYSLWLVALLRAVDAATYPLLGWWGRKMDSYLLQRQFGVKYKHPGSAITYIYIYIYIYEDH